MRFSSFLLLACLAFTAQGKHAVHSAVQVHSGLASSASQGAKSLYEQMVEVAAKGDAAGLNEIITLVKDTLIPALETDVRNRQADLDKKWSDIETCGSTLATCTSTAGGDSLGATATSATNAYNTAKTNKAAAATVEVCESGTFSGDDGADEVAAKVADAKTKFDAAVTKYNEAALAEKNAAEAMWKAKDAQSAHLGECHGVCKGCVAATNSAYDEAAEAARGVLPSQQDDLRTYELIICVAKESASTNDATKLKACREAVVDVSRIAYTFKDKPTVDCGTGGACAAPEAPTKCDSEAGKSFLEGCAHTFCEVQRTQCVVASNLMYSKCMTCMDEWCGRWASSAWCPGPDKARERCADHSTHHGLVAAPAGGFVETEADGGAWTKVYQIDGQTQFALSSAAVGTINSPDVTESAKMSDADINSIAKSRDGYSHVYKGYSPKASKNLYIRTNQPFDDTKRSWNVGTSAQIGLADSYSGVTTWAAIKGGTHGIDLLYTSPNLGGESCNRYFLGHGAVDCYSGDANKRCVRGGTACGSDYPILNDFRLSVYTGSTTTAASLAEAGATIADPDSDVPPEVPAL